MREQTEILGLDADPTDIRDAAYVQVAESKTMRMLARHSAQLRRAYEKAWKEIITLQQEEVEAGEQNEPMIPLNEAMLHFLTAPPRPLRPDTDLSREDSSEDTSEKVA